MVTFPLLTPSDFRWEAPTYEQVSHTAEDGAVVRQILMDTPGQGRVEVEFQNCRDSDFEAVLAAHDATYGQWDALTLPDAFWGGRSAELRALIEGYHPSLEWAFAEVPAADWAKKGRCTIKVTLKHRVRPLALTLAPGGTATPLVPLSDPGTPAMVDALPVLNCNIVVPPLPDTVGCQAFWGLRLNTRALASQNNNFYPVNLVAADGSMYHGFMFLPVGQADINQGTIVIVKTDKDGAVQWITKSTAPRSNASFTMYLTSTGIGLAVDRDAVGGSGTSHIGLYWGIAANGSQQYHTSYAPGSGGWWNAVHRPAVHGGFTVFFYTWFSGCWATKVINGTPTKQSFYQEGNPEATLPLAGNQTLVIGQRQGTGWLCVLDSDLNIVSEYVYNNTKRFYGIESYDASTWAVIDDGNTAPSARLLLLSKADYNVVTAYFLPEVGNPGVRSMVPAVNGIIKMAKRDNTYVEIDVPKAKGSIRRYESMWRIGGLVARGEDFPITPRVAIDVAQNRVITYYQAVQQVSRPDMEFNRLLFASFGLQIPAGSYALNAQPPYGDSNVELTVTETPVALTTVSPLPLRTIATNVTTPTATMGLPAPSYLAPFSTPADGEFDFSLQSAPICPPPLTTVAISGPATVPSNIDERFFAAVLPDPAASTWPHTYAWSSPDAVFSSTSVYNPLVKWNLPIGQKRTLTLTVSNAGYSKTATLEVTIGAAVAQFNEDFF